MGGKITEERETTFVSSYREVRKNESLRNRDCNVHPNPNIEIPVRAPCLLLDSKIMNVVSRLTVRMHFEV